MAFCVNCGSKVEDGVGFCSNCGTKIGSNIEREQAVEQTQQNQQFAQNGPDTIRSENVNAEDSLLRAYIMGTTDPYASNPNYEHYKNAFYKLSNGSKTSWNWAAFLTGGWNLAYRKSYLWGVVFYFAALVLSGISSGLLTILGWIAAGIFADYFHYSRYKEQLSIAKKTYPNNIQGQLSYMAGNGGVNKMVIWVAVIISIIAIIVIISIAVAAASAISFFDI